MAQCCDQERAAAPEDPAGTRLQAAYDSVRNALDLADTGAGRTPDRSFGSDPGSFRRAVIGLLRDPSAGRGLRVEMLQLLVMAPCTNAEELIFGPAPDTRGAFAWARAHLARFASDSALFDLMYEESERAPPVTPGLVAKLIAGAADALGFVLRNRRIPACTRGLLSG